MKSLTLKSGKKIYIFDDCFSVTQQRYFKDFAQDCYLKPTGKSTHAWEHSGIFLLAKFGPKDFENFKLLENKNHEIDPVLSLIGPKQIVRAWILFSDLSTKIHYHTDVAIDGPPAYSLLYYINVEWKDSWGGETIFANEDGEAEIAVSYKPGRIVLFDSTINHKAACISADAPYRYTFNCVFQ